MENNMIIFANSITIKDIPNTVKLLPLGEVKSQKGNFFVDKYSYQSIVQKFKNRKVDLVIDYEHQTLDNVQAPASGWVKEIILKNDGIYALVEWTEKASQYIKSKEYRYLSPVILVDKNTRKVHELHSVALTNTPAIDGMEAIINSLNKGVDTMDIQKENTLNEDIDDLKTEETTIEKTFALRVIKELGLKENASTVDILKAIRELKQSREEKEVIANKLIIEKINTESQQLVQMALSIGQIDESQKEWAHKRCLEDIEGFKFFVNGAYKKECDNAVTLALKSGKICPYQKEWAEQLALKDLDCFKTFIEQALPVIPLGEMEYLKDDTYNGAVVSHNSPNQLLGISDEEVKKYDR